MSLLQDVILDLRKPVVEGKGIKVFAITEVMASDQEMERDKAVRGMKANRAIRGRDSVGKKGHFMVRKGPDGWYVRKHIGLGTEDVSGPHPNKETAEKHVPVNEGWGWEDVYDDMLDDLGVQTLVQDIAKDWKIAQEQGLSGKVFLDYVSSNMRKYEDEAQVELTDEEWTVMLKVVENAVLKGKSFTRPWKVKESMAKRQMASRDAKEYPGGWNRQTKKSDPSLTPDERGGIAAQADVSLDWNPETDEYNPYEPGTSEFEAYERAFADAIEYLKDKFPHI